MFKTLNKIILNYIHYYSYILYINNTPLYKKIYITVNHKKRFDKFLSSLQQKKNIQI